MLKKIVLPLAVVVMLSACHHRLKTQIEDPQVYGTGQYVIYYQSKKAPSKMKARAVKKANSYCQKHNATMSPVSNSETERYHYQLIFSCQAGKAKAVKADASKQTDKPDESDDSDEHDR